MSKYKVVLTDYEYDSIAGEERILKNADAELVPMQCHRTEELISVLSDADAVLNQYTRITRKVLDNMKRCRIIVRYGVGVDNIDVQAATDNNIMVCNVPDYGLDEVADHTMALLLSSIRKIVLQNALVKGSKWDYKLAYPLYRIKGKKLGLVAFGNIAQKVAARARAFGMEILVFDPWVESGRLQEYGAKSVSFDNLLRNSDYISIHCPLNDSSRHMFNLNAFTQMKNTAILVNTARGSIIDEKALLKALQDGLIAAAAIDVTEHEPVAADSQLLQLDNIIITPHAAWYSVEAQQSLQEQAAEEIARVLSGEKPLHLVNKAVLR